MQKVINFFSIIISFIIIPIVLIWVGYSHVPHLFSGEFTRHTGSIEVSYMTMAKFIEKSWPHFSWQPLWYLGYPMDTLYTPVVPFFEFFSKVFLGWSYGHAYRFLSAFSYVGVLVTLFLFARTLFKNSTAGFAASLSYAILPSIIAYLYPEVAGDSFALELVDPRRFTILVRWGEGPHIVSLMFLPLAALFIVKFLRNGGKFSFVLGSIFTALVILTNTVGAWGLFLLGISMIIGNISEKVHEWKSTILRSFLFGALTYGLISYWFNPLFLSSFFREGGSSLSYWKNQFPWGWLIILFVLGIYIFIMKKLAAKLYGISASTMFFIIMFYLVNTYYASGLEHVELVPQVLRLNTEVDLGFSLLIGGFVSVIGVLVKKFAAKIYLPIMGVLAIGFAIALIPRQLELSKILSPFTLPAEAVGIDLKSSAQYEVAKTLEQKVTGDERVLVSGNYGFYLNYFVDLPQLRGALFQSSVHPWPEHIYYQITNGRNSDIALALLKIANVGWLVYPGPREIYRDYKQPPEKFDEVLTLVEDKNTEKYYQVPLSNSSLAKAVDQGIERLSTPVNAIDEAPIYAYTDILDKSSGLNIKELENGSYEINGEVANGKIILVQQSYVPGWKAVDARGQNLQVQKDPLGFILIKSSNYSFPIKLSFGKTWRIWLGWALTFIALVTIVIILLIIKKPLLSFKPKPKEENLDAQ